MVTQLEQLDELEDLKPERKVDDKAMERIIERIDRTERKKGLEHFPKKEVIPAFRQMFDTIGILDEQIDQLKKFIAAFLGHRRRTHHSYCTGCEDGEIVIDWSEYGIETPLVCTNCGPRMMTVDPFDLKVEEDDPVDHPSHYNMGGIEVFAAIEAWKLGYPDGQVVKYVARAQYKGNYLEDLQKARWYLDAEIRRLGGDPEEDLLGGEEE